MEARTLRDKRKKRTAWEERSHAWSSKRPFTQLRLKGPSFWQSEHTDEAGDSSPEDDEVDDSELRSITTSGCGVGTRWSATERKGTRGTLPRVVASGRGRMRGVACDTTRGVGAAAA